MDALDRAAIRLFFVTTAGAAACYLYLLTLIV